MRGRENLFNFPSYSITKNKERQVTVMRQAVTTVQYVFAGIGGFMGWFLGGLDGFLYALLMLWSSIMSPGLWQHSYRKRYPARLVLKASAKGGNLLSGRYRPCA